MDAEIRAAERAGDEERAAALRERMGGERVRYRLMDSGTDVPLAATTEREAIREAREATADVYAQDHDGAGTFWVDVAVQRSEDYGETWEDVRDLKVEVSPAEPECRDGEDHAWLEGRCYGNGGGVRSTDRCWRCGLTRIEDTWAQDPTDGVQGLHSVTYVEGPVTRHYLTREMLGDGATVRGLARVVEALEDRGWDVVAGHGPNCRDRDERDAFDAAVSEVIEEEVDPAESTWLVYGDGPASSELVRGGQAATEWPEEADGCEWCVHVAAREDDVDAATRHDDAVTGYKEAE